jgi:hypothetical protein
VTTTEPAEPTDPEEPTESEPETTEETTEDITEDPTEDTTGDTTEAEETTEPEETTEETTEVTTEETTESKLRLNLKRENSQMLCLPATISLTCSKSTESKFSLFDGTTYIKTACFVEEPSSQASALAYCESNSMKLFIIDTDVVQNVLFYHVEPTYQSSNKIFRVDGVRDSGDGNWYYSSGQTPALATLKWLISSDTYETYDYMMISNTGWPMTKLSPTFSVDGVDSETPFPFICEFAE